MGLKILMHTVRNLSLSLMRTVSLMYIERESIFMFIVVLYILLRTSNTTTREIPPGVELKVSTHTVHK
jgi:hypothetical protein